MKVVRLVHGSALALGLLAAPLRAQDWPMDGHDALRSNTSGQVLEARRLELAWTHRASLAPRPAWPAPARWDAYVRRRVIVSMRDYDQVFRPVVARGRLYYGSSADDTLRCLDLERGEVQWSFAAGAAIRNAPAWDEGRLYFGADDGFVYCLDDEDGRLLWRYRPGGSGRVLQDGRLVSRWPCRCGVLVSEGTLYAGFSLLPWRETYLCALDAKTGRPDGERRWVRTVEGLTLEGRLLASGELLVATQGRAAPRLFRRSDGADLGPLEGVVGGSFALAAPDQTVFVGRGGKEGYISEADRESGTVVAKKFRALDLLVRGNVTYSLERNLIGALQRKPEKWLWRIEEDHPCALIAAGDLLFLGGDGEVVARRTADGARVWAGRVEGRARCLVAASGALIVSTDHGVLHCFRPGDERTEAPVSERTPAPEESIWKSAGSRHEEPSLPSVPDEIFDGPYVRFVAPRGAEIRWSSRAPSPTVLEYGALGLEGRVEELERRTRHEVRLQGLAVDEVYSYVIATGSGADREVSPPFEFDTAFREDDASRRGLCVTLGITDPVRLEALARDGARVAAIVDDAGAAAHGRRTLLERGALGTRVEILEAGSAQELRLPRRFARWVVAENWSGVATLEQALRLLRPEGGEARFLGSPAEVKQLAASVPQTHDGSPMVVKTVDSGELVVRRGPLAGIGEWTHQYGRADNATYAGETLEGARSVRDLEVQWLGRPGPRHQSDRQTRQPAPLCAEGRLFVQGLDRVSALDAYSGVMLWNLEIPGARRFNVRQDASNVCLGAGDLFLAIREQCWRVDAATGEVLSCFEVPAGARSTAESAWGYVGCSGGLLIGTATRRGAAYRDFWGGQYWYEATEGELARKVVGDELFAVDPTDGAVQWTRSRGLIPHTALALGPRRAFFFECRHADVLALSERRLSAEELWKDVRLVAVDLGTGQVEFDVAVDLDAPTNMISLALGEDTIVAVSSARGSFDIQTWDDSDGEALWRRRVDWSSDGKGGHASRPAIVEGTLYVSPESFDLRSGEEKESRLVRGACGSYAATRHVVLSRVGNLGMWCAETGEVSSWPRLRPDCWLSVIPAAGMVLAPEGGGGCSCGGWLETSIAFAPVQR